ncbi:hypothetical protein GGI12_003748 [Dipsacomyces acuminosporus]|nr:hypothetical protein GGI12_003748 [Dipsacomyces acuminosporus]
MLLSASKRSEKTTQTKASGIYKYEPLKTANGMIVWTKAEDERLRELVIEKRRFDHLDLRRHFPGFNYYNIYNALQRLSAEPGHVKGLWTNAEHRSLLKLIDEYGDDWLKVAENMPTRRTVSQCRAHYMTCCTKPVVKRGRWSNEEEEKLRHLVAICKEGKLRPEIEVFYQSKSGSSQPSLIKGSASSKSPRDISLARFELYSRFADALKRDKGSRTDAQGKNSTATKIVWPLVASYMETRSVTQCRLKWFYMQKGRGSEDAVYSGPWTRGEDAALYKLYHKHPRRWLWIAQNLPRRRKWISVRARYNSYVRRYVDMLKECKPAGWDPADDQFEEVHARCEILAWYRGQLEGYRAGDPYQCPYDMDLTGYKEWIKETSADAAEKAGLPFESNTEKTGWSARAVPHKNRKQ